MPDSSDALPLTEQLLEQLTDLAEGHLPAESQAAVRAVLATNPAAQAHFEWLQQVLADRRHDTDQDAPVHVVARAVRLIRPITPVQAAEPAPLLQRIIGMLSFDSAHMVAEGVRSTIGSQRQLLFQSALMDLDLRVVAHTTGFEIIGQVLDPQIPQAIRLLRVDAGETAPTLLHEVATNMLGEFSFPHIPAGVYQIVVVLRHHELLIELVV